MMRGRRALAVAALVVALLLAFSARIERGDQLPAPPPMLIWFSQ